MLIEQSTDAAKKAINIQKYMIGSTFKVVGTITAAIIIEIPTIPVPEDVMTVAFEAEDANWQQMTDGALAYQLDEDNLSKVLDGALGWIRLNKQSGDDVGIEHKW